MNRPDEEKPKIIIDEDWKSQVEQERSRLKTPTPEGTQSEETQPTPSETFEGRLPTPSFDLLLSTLATQALACLGQIPDPFENRPIVRLELGKHHIEMLAVLEEKTKGNLTPDEQAALDSILHQLRMIYVSVKDRPQQTQGS